MSVEREVRVLLVEDNPADVRFVNELLNDLGRNKFRLKNAGTLNEALNLIKEASFDIILLDLNLPDSNGFDTINKIRRAVINTPIIVLTVASSKEIPLQALKLGIQEFLIKGSINSNLLGQVINYSISRMNFEKAILDRSEIFNAFLNSVEESALLIDVKGNIILANYEAMKRLSSTVSEIVGKNIYRLMPAKFAIKEKYHVAKAIKIKKSISFEDNRGSRDYEHHIYPLIESDGSIKHIALLSLDITKRMKAESELLFSKLLLQSEFESSIDGILIVDETGKILSFNKRFINLWNIPKQVIESRSDKQAIANVLDKLVDPKGFISKVNYLYKNKNEVSRGEVILKDGRTFDRYSSPLLGNDGKYYGRAWYFRDVTEQKNEEKERLERESIKKLQKLREEFLMLITHDLKQPLIPILGYVDLLKPIVTDTKGESYLNRIKDSSYKMRDMINKITNLFKLEEGQLALNIETYDLSKVMSDVLDYKNSFITLKGLRIINKLGLNVKAKFDHERLRDVLANLIDNAIKFTSKGGSITVKTWLKGNKAYASIKDSGIGFKKIDMDNLFKKFYQSTEGKALGGSGIGLTLVKKIIDAHNGDIKVKSVYGKGAEFIIELPAK